MPRRGAWHLHTGWLLPTPKRASCPTPSGSLPKDRVGFLSDSLRESPLRSAKPIGWKPFRELDDTVGFTDFAKGSHSGAVSSGSEAGT